MGIGAACLFEIHRYYIFCLYFYVPYILPKLVPKSKDLVKDLAVNPEKKIGEEVHLYTIVRNVNSNKIFAE